MRNEAAFGCSFGCSFSFASAWLPLFNHRAVPAVAVYIYHAALLSTFSLFI